MLMHICRIYKNDIDDLICIAEIETQIQRTNVQIPRGKGRWWDELEIEMDIYTIDTMYRQLMRTDQHKKLNSVLCGDLNGKETQKEGIYVYVGGSVVKTLPATQEMWV